MYKLFFTQKLPIDLPTAWNFFSSPSNLEKITPKSMSFKINHHHENKKMFSGQIISYSFRPIWFLKLEWVTEIIVAEEPRYFIDEQKFGPYTFWHHEHWFKPIEGGILMEDVIYYKVPFGLLGKALHRFKIKKDLDRIFLYRNNALEKIFGRL